MAEAGTYMHGKITCMSEAGTSWHEVRRIIYDKSVLSPRNIFPNKDRVSSLEENAHTCIAMYISGTFTCVYNNM